MQFSSFKKCQRSSMFQPIVVTFFEYTVIAVKYVKLTLFLRIQHVYYVRMYIPLYQPTGPRCCFLNVC